MAPHLRERLVEQDDLGGAGGVHRGAHVHDARVADVDDGATGRRELQHHQRRQHLGVGLDDRAGERERRRGAGQRQAVDGDGHAVRGQQQRRLEAVGVVLQRRDRAVHDREDRPLRPPDAVVAGGREHLHHVRHLARLEDLALDVLARARQHRLQAAQRLRARRLVAGVGGVPAHADLVERVGDDHRVGQVADRRRPALAAAVVQRHRAHAVVGDERARMVEEGVPGPVPRGQQHRLGRRLQRALDEVGGEAGDAGLVVDDRAGVAQQGEGARRPRPDADVRQQPQGLLVHVLDVGRAEHAEARPRDDRLGPHRRTPWPRPSLAGAVSACLRGPFTRLPSGDADGGVGLFDDGVDARRDVPGHRLRPVLAQRPREPSRAIGRRGPSPPAPPSPRARGGRCTVGWESSRMWRSVASSERKSPNAPTAAMSSTARVSSLTGMPCDHVLDHPGDLVVHDELPAIEGDARLDHPRTVDQVGPCQRCHESGEGLLVPDLGVTELRVRLQPGDEARQQVAPRQLSHRGADEGDLRRADARRRELEVHGRRRAAVHDRRSRAP